MFSRRRVEVQLNTIGEIAILEGNTFAMVPKKLEGTGT